MIYEKMTEKTKIMAEGFEKDKAHLQQDLD
jgi:hypothetical protein